MRQLLLDISGMIFLVGYLTLGFSLVVLLNDRFNVNFGASCAWLLGILGAIMVCCIALEVYKK